MGLVLHGSCGERLEFGVSEPLTPAKMPENACRHFCELALETFGPSGSRRLPVELPPVEREPMDPAFSRYLKAVRNGRIRDGNGWEGTDLPEPFDPSTGLGRRPGSDTRGRF